MDKLRCIEERVELFKRQRPIRGGSLILTLFTDALSTRDSSVWLGSLINLLSPMGLNQRLVRTAIFRLTQDGWLTSNQIGRRSFYCLSSHGKERVSNLTQRIYSDRYPEWDGKWDLIITTQLDNELKRVIKKNLEMIGFGNVAPGVLAHPEADNNEVQNTLQELCVEDEVILMRAELRGDLASAPLKQLIQECWNLDQLGDEYQAFLNSYSPILETLKQQPSPSPEQCFQLRTLLIHDYRLLLQKDPQLPHSLLPENWIGSSGRTLCQQIYRLIYEQADQYLTAIMETANGPLPEADATLYSRYGGLLEQ